MDLPDAAARVTVPTTVLWGERDHALLPGLLDGLPGWVPQLQLMQIENASHWIVHEQPATVARVVLDEEEAAVPGFLVEQHRVVEGEQVGHAVEPVEFGTCTLKEATSAAIRFLTVVFSDMSGNSWVGTDTG